MHLSKLFDILHCMDAEEWKRLNDYVHSPYFKVPSASVALFDYLYPLHPGFAVKKISVEAIGKSGSNLSTSAKQATAASALIKAATDFMCIEAVRADSQTMELSQLAALKAHGLTDEFDKLFNNTFNHLEKSRERNIPFFEHRHKLIESNITGFNARLKRTTANSLDAVLNSLNEFYALKALRYLCEAQNRHLVLGVPLPEVDANPLLQILEPLANTNYPYVYLFVQVYDLWNRADYQKGLPAYERIKGYLKQIPAGTLSEGEKEVAYYASGITQLWFNDGIEEAAEECQWWTEFKIKHGLLVQNGRLLPIAFRNSVAIAVQTHKSPKWINDFIKNYSPYLPVQYREKTTAFAEGLSLYLQNQYTLASRKFLLADAGNEAPFDAMIRRWHFMSLYESNPEDYGVLDNFLLAFKKYLQRNLKELHRLKDFFDLFIRFSQKLIAIHNKEDAGKLLEQLEKSAYFPGKYWIREQAKIKRPARH